MAGHFGFEIVHHATQGLDDIEHAVASSTRDGVGALYVSGELLADDVIAWPRAGYRSFDKKSCVDG